jgi:hypothetical protein
LTLTEEGQVTEGDSESVTVTVKEHEPDLPALSEAVPVIVVTPRVNAVPLGTLY